MIMPRGYNNSIEFLTICKPWCGYLELVAYMSTSLCLDMPVWEQFERLAAYLPLSAVFPYLLHTCIVAKFYLLLDSRGDTFDVIGNDPMVYKVRSTIQPRVIFDFE